MLSKDYLRVDEKKMKRMMSNRESARRSRMKKDKHMKDLNEQIFYFTKNRDEMALKIEGLVKEHSALEMENKVLRTQKQELRKRLEYAKSVSGCYEYHDHECDGIQEPWFIRPFEQQQLQPPSNSMPLFMGSISSK